MARVKGLLWFDTDGTLEARLRRAIIHYERKYGKRARCILVNASEADESGLYDVDGVSVRPSNLMLTGHYLVGEESNDLEASG